MSEVCPECLEETAEKTEHEVTDAGVRWSYECERCGHVWDVVF